MGSFNPVKSINVCDCVSFAASAPGSTAAPQPNAAIASGENEAMLAKQDDRPSGAGSLKCHCN